MSKQHNCDKNDSHLHIRVGNGKLTLMDEYTFEVNYCPYCGKSPEELTVEMSDE